ncbi:hypothetical protein ACF07Q_27775 [Nocardiopsis dassonvillei]|uniref:hypothetical protein n=1 Tax=Nocardiopsis dassonvillei TaxID=2014 RepID=UPI0036FE962A
MSDFHPQVPFRFDVIKAYPQRGPLCQYRLSAATAFECSRCGKSKKAKLISVILDDWSRLLCNACYGRLLSLWEIKSGESTDEERHEGILSLLRGLSSEDQVERSRRALLERHGQSGFLSQAALTMLATSEAVASGLSLKATELDWSAAVIGLCKAVEIEAIRLVVEPLRRSVEGRDLSRDLKDQGMKRMARFCSGSGYPPELGAFGYFLAAVGKQRRQEEESVISAAMRDIGRDWPNSGLLFESNEGGFISSVKHVAREYRNPAAHTALLTRKEYDSCNEMIQGEGGILWNLYTATRSYRK